MTAENLNRYICGEYEHKCVCSFVVLHCPKIVHHWPTGMNKMLFNIIHSQFDGVRAHHHCDDKV